jgi:hypothetical protein
MATSRMRRWRSASGLRRGYGGRDVPTTQFCYIVATTDFQAYSVIPQGAIDMQARHCELIRLFGLCNLVGPHYDVRPPRSLYAHPR